MAKRISVSPPASLVLDGKSSPKLRAGHQADISETQIETFFATLGETCNVALAAKAAGINKSWAYRRRRRDAGFRNAWAEAVREGYAKLELVLLERAIKGTPKPLFRKDGSERIVREYSTALAVALLKRHAETADSASYEPAQEELAEIRERILERLDRIRERDGEIETKSAAGRLEVIRYAIASRKGEC
jgi:hypothetical protein